MYDDYKLATPDDSYDCCERCGCLCHSSELTLINLNFKYTLCCESCVEELNN